MPDPVAHYVFGLDVLEKLPPDIRQRVNHDIFVRALQGPDPWSTIGFYGGKFKQYAVRSNVMHKSRTGEFLKTLAKEAENNDQVYSVLLGFLCHYCLDKLAHPYIICKGGEYDGTLQTRAQHGGHVRLERAVDCWFIRNRFQRIPWHFSIPRRIMPLKQYPDSLREPMNRVYRKVYGWESVFDALNRSLRDERLFYGLMQDPLGIVHYLLRPLSTGKTNYCIYSYFRRDAKRESLDYMNETHQSWSHPFDPTISSKESFFDLYERAIDEALDLISGLRQGIYRFGNASYSTGFDWEDSRNQNVPAYEPLQYPHKYWNIP